MAVGDDELRTRFTHHSPTTDQTDRFNAIRAGAFTLARMIDEMCPDSREKADALTNLDYVVYQANAAIARRER